MTTDEGREPGAEYMYQGAAVLVSLHEEHLSRFLETWKTAKGSGIALPAVDDPDYASWDALLHHVYRWARTYLVWTCDRLELAKPELRPVPDVAIVGTEATAYLQKLLRAWRGPLVGVEAKRFFVPEYGAPWKVRYCIEAMLEHAVMHPLRHRFQIEEWILEKRK